MPIVLKVQRESPKNCLSKLVQGKILPQGLHESYLHIQEVSEKTVKLS